MPDDIELLCRYAREGSEEAFAELVHQRLGFVYAVALRGVGGDAHLAEDVAQRVFARLARKAPQLAERTVLAGWLYRTTRFVAVDVVRAEHRRRRREQEAQLMQAPDDTPQTDWEAIRPELDQAISELGDVDRDAVVLRFFESQAFAEIGQRLRLTEDTARKRVERALEKVRQALARRGVKSSSAALAVILADKSALATVPASLAATITGAALGGKLAVGGGLGLGIFAFMNTTKTVAGISGIAALLAIGISIHQTNVARDASSGLAQSEQVVAGLRRELQEVQRRFAEARATPAPPTAATAPAIATPPTAVNPPLWNPVADMRPVTQHRNVGRATPETGFETAIWAAMTSGQEDTLADSFVLEGAAKSKADELWSKLSEGVRTWAGRPEKLLGLGFTRDLVEKIDRMQVLGVVHEQDPNWVTLNLRMLTLGEGERKPKLQESKMLQMRKVGGEWKLATREDMVDRSLRRDVEAIVAGRKPAP
jgi:RNA polymerase sigma factor (sigma-70 family)